MANPCGPMVRITGDRVRFKVVAWDVPDIVFDPEGPPRTREAVFRDNPEFMKQIGLPHRPFEDRRR